MSNTKQYIAVDLGAESGRVMLGTVSDSRLDLEEIHRFGNGPVEQDGSLRWAFGKLFSDIKDGIAKAVKSADGQVCGIAVDSWGVDFGLIDADGKLLENPYQLILEVIGFSSIIYPVYITNNYFTRMTMEIIIQQLILVGYNRESRITIIIW